MKLLLNDDRIDINKASDGEAPFWIACSYNRIETVKLLLNDERVDFLKQIIMKQHLFLLLVEMDIVKLSNYC